jgi:hypothetical protein
MGGRCSLRRSRHHIERRDYQAVRVHLKSQGTKPYRSVLTPYFSEFREVNTPRVV